MANESSDEKSGLITSRPLGLVDVLDRILDKGLVIAGDIKISLTNIELLTLQIRLIICSIDKAEQIGLNWWRYDPNLTVPQPAQGSRPSESPGESADADKLTETPAPSTASLVPDADSPLSTSPAAAPPAPRRKSNSPPKRGKESSRP